MMSASDFDRHENDDISDSEPHELLDDNAILHTPSRSMRNQIGEDDLSLLSEHLATVKLAHEEKVFELSTEIRTLRKLLRSTETENRKFKQLVLASPERLAPKKISFDEEELLETPSNEPQILKENDPVAIAWDRGNQEFQEGNVSDGVRHYTTAARMLAANLSAAEARVQEVENTLADVESDLKKYKESKGVIESLETELIGRDSLIDEMRARMADFEAIKEKNKSLMKKLDDNEEQIRNYENQIDSLKQKNAESQSRIEFLTDEWDIKESDHKDLIAKLENDLKTCKASISEKDALLKEHLTSIETLKTACASGENAAESMEQELKTLRQQVIALEESKVSVNEKNAELSRQCIDLEYECKQTQESLTASQMCLQTLTSDSNTKIEQWKQYGEKQKQQFEKKKEKMLTAISTLKAKIADLEAKERNDKSESESKIKELYDIIETKEDEIEQYRSTSNQMSNLQVQLQQAQEQLEIQINENYRVTEAMAALEQEKMAISEELEKKVELIKKVGKKYKKVQNENVELAAKLAEMPDESQLSYAAQTEQLLRDDLANAHARLQAMSNENEELHEKTNTLTSRVDDLTSKWEALSSTTSEEADRLRENVSALEKKLNETRHISIQYECETESLRGQLLELQGFNDKVEHLETCLSEANNEILSLKESNNSLQSDLDARDEMVHDLETQLFHLKQQPPMTMSPSRNTTNNAAGVFDIPASSPVRGVESLFDLEPVNDSEDRMEPERVFNWDEVAHESLPTDAVQQSASHEDIQRLEKELDQLRQDHAEQIRSMELNESELLVKIQHLQKANDMGSSLQEELNELRLREEQLSNELQQKHIEMDELKLYYEDLYSNLKREKEEFNEQAEAFQNQMEFFQNSEQNEGPFQFSQQDAFKSPTQQKFDAAPLNWDQAAHTPLARAQTPTQTFDDAQPMNWDQAAHTPLAGAQTPTQTFDDVPAMNWDQAAHTPIARVQTPTQTFDDAPAMNWDQDAHTPAHNHLATQSMSEMFDAAPMEWNEVSHTPNQNGAQSPSHNVFDSEGSHTHTHDVTSHYDTEDVAQYEWNSTVNHDNPENFDPKALIKSIPSPHRDAAVAQMSREMEDLRNREASLLTTIKSLNEFKVAADENQRMLNEALEGMKVQVDELKAVKSKSAMDVDFARQLEESRNEIEFLEKQLETCESAADANTVELNRRINELEGEKKTALVKLNGVQEERDTALKRLNEIEFDHNLDKQKLEIELQDKLKALEEMKLSIELSRKAEEEAKYSLQVADEVVSGFEAEKFRLEMDIANLENQLTAGRAAFKEAMEKATEEWQAKISHAESSLARNESLLDELNSRLAGMVQKYASAQNELQEELKSSQQKLAFKEEMIKALKSEHDKEHHQLAHELQALKLENGKHEVTLRSFAQRANKLIGINRLLQAERDQARQEAAAMFTMDTASAEDSTPKRRSRSPRMQPRSMANVLLSQKESYQEFDGAELQTLDEMDVNEDVSSIQKRLAQQFGDLLGDLDTSTNDPVDVHDVIESVDECNQLLATAMEYRNAKVNELESQIESSRLAYEDLISRYNVLEQSMNEQVAAYEELRRDRDQLLNQLSSMQPPTVSTPVDANTTEQMQLLQVAFDRIQQENQDLRQLQNQLQNQLSSIQPPAASTPVDDNTTEQMQLLQVAFDRIQQENQDLRQLQNQLQNQLSSIQPPAASTPVDDNTTEQMQLLQVAFDRIQKENQDLRAQATQAGPSPVIDTQTLHDIQAEINECMSFANSLGSNVTREEKKQSSVVVEEQPKPQVSRAETSPSASDGERDRLKRERDDAMKRISRLEKQLAMRKSIFGHNSSSPRAPGSEAERMPSSRTPTGRLSPSRMLSLRQKKVPGSRINSLILDARAECEVEGPDSPLVTPWSDKFWKLSSDQQRLDEEDDDRSEFQDEDDVIDGVAPQIPRPESPYALPQPLNIHAPTLDEVPGLDSEPNSGGSWSPLDVFASGAKSTMGSDCKSPAGFSANSPTGSVEGESFAQQEKSASSSAATKKVKSSKSKVKSPKSPGQPGFIRKMFGIGKARDLVEAGMKDDNSDFDETEESNKNGQDKEQDPSKPGNADPFQDPFRAGEAIRQRTPSTFSQRSVERQQYQYPAYNLSLDPTAVVTDDFPQDGTPRERGLSIQTKFPSHDTQYASQSPGVGQPYVYATGAPFGTALSPMPPPSAHSVQGIFPSSPASFMGNDRNTFDFGESTNAADTFHMHGDEAEQIEILREKIATLERELEQERDLRLWRDRQYGMTESELRRYMDIVEEYENTAGQAVGNVSSVVTRLTTEGDALKTQLKSYEKSATSPSPPKSTTVAPPVVPPLMGAGATPEVVKLNDALRVANEAANKLRRELESIKSLKVAATAEVDRLRQILAQRDADYDRIVKNLGCAMYTGKSVAEENAVDSKAIVKQGSGGSSGGLVSWIYYFVLPNGFLVLLAFLITVGAPPGMLEDYSPETYLVRTLPS